MYELGKQPAGAGSSRAATLDDLVLLHAIALDAGQWDWCGGLRERGLALTLPGHGDVALPADRELSLAAVADWVCNRLVERLRAGPGRPVHLVGLSMGGMVAQHLLVRHPELVASAVLVCTRPAADRKRMLERASETRDKGMEAQTVSTLERWFTSDALASPGHPGVEYARARLIMDDPGAVASYWTAMADHDLRAELAEVERPVTVVVGRHDVTSTLEAGAEFAGLFPVGRLDVRDGPHLLSLERPDETESAIFDHLAWIGRG